MGGKLVTDGLPDSKRGGSESCPPFLERYTEKLDELCGFYLSLGMSYGDYWDGDCCMVKHYRSKAEFDKERKNRYLWLQGLYIYEALLDVSPVINTFSGKTKPRPYMKEPIAIANDENKRANALKMQNGKNAVRMMMAEINKRFERNEE